MMTRTFCLFLSLMPFNLAVHAQTPPKGIAVSTWVREDIFAGFMGGDMERFGQGMKKLDTILAANPRAADALAWKGGGELFLAVKAHEEGKTGEFDAAHSKALGTFEEAGKAGEGTRAMGAVHAISGGSWAVFADRMPEKHRREAWGKVRAHYTTLKALQSDVFEKLPLHMRGEVLAGLAQASQRLGEEDFKVKLQEVIDKLSGSPYATRARRWQENPESAARSSITCQTCHAAGRLDAVMSASKR